MSHNHFRLCNGGGICCCEMVAALWSNLPHLEEDCVVCVTSAVPCRLFPPDSDCVNQSVSFKNRSRIK